MATTLMISGFGDAGTARYLSTAGADLGQPASAFVLGSGVSGLARLSGNDIAIVGANAPNFSTTGAGAINGDDITLSSEAATPDANIGGFCVSVDASNHYYTAVVKSHVGVHSFNVAQWDPDSDTATDTWTSIAYNDTLYAPNIWDIAVSPDGLTLYVWMTGEFGQADDGKWKIHIFDLTGAGAYVGKLDDTHYTQRAPGSGNSLFCTASGDIVAAFASDGALSNDGVVRRYSAAGSVLHTYTFSGGTPKPYYMALDVAGTGFWVNVADGDAPTTNGAKLYHLLLSDGSDVDPAFFPADDDDFAFNSPFTVLGLEIVPEPTPTPSGIPISTPAAPQTDCTPQSQTSTAVRGEAGCNDGGAGFVLEYDGAWGTVPVHPEPPAHERLTGKDRLTVEAWVEVNTLDYPSGDPVQLLRAMVPLADDSDYEGGSKTDGLLAVGDVEDALGNEQGGFEATTVDVQISGARDNTVHTSADDQDFGGAEVIVKLASDEARAAGTPPLIMMRSILQQIQFRSHKHIAIKALDQLFSDGGVYGPNSQFPHKTYGDLGRAAPQMTDDVKALPIVPLYGEKTDNGAVNPTTGAVNPKGLIPGVYLGKFLVSGLTTPAATTGRTLAEAVALMQGLVNTNADDATWESTLGFDIGTSDIVNLKAMGTVPNTYFSLGFVIGYADLDEVLRHGTTAAPTDGEYGILAFGYGPVYAFTKVFGSDLGGGIPENKHDRTLLDFVARAGSDLLVPGDGVCPWTAFTLTNPDTGETFDLAAIGVRGPLLDDHLNGVVNIAADMIGLMDADGLPIMGAYDAAFHAIENFMYLGKTAGPWATNATAPKYSDGVYKVNSASFAACQAYSATSLGGHGLRASWYPDTQKSKTQAMGDLMRDLEFRMGYDRHGQLRAFLLDETLDPTTWPRIVHEIHVFGDVEITQGESRENIATGVCDWDPDFARYRGERITERSDVAIAKYRKGTSTGERPGDQTIENAVINGDDHLHWLLRRRVARLGSGMTLITLVGRREWWDPEYDVGRGVLVNTLDGTGANGYVDRPGIVLRRRFSFDTQLVTLTVWDVRDVLIATAFEDGLSRIPYETDDEDDAFWETDDPDLAPLELL